MSFKVGDKVKCIDNEYVEDFFTLGETYVIDEVQQDGHIGFLHTGYTLWHSDRFELIEKEKDMEKQFNPQLGDRIICNNGEEYTCCTLEFLQENIASGIDSTKPILGYSSHGWCGWWANGKYDSLLSEWTIREVISQKREQPLPEETEVKPEITYSVEDIRKAVIDDLGWQNLSLDLIMKALDRVTNPEYNEYLRLKAMFESAETDEE